MPDHGDDPLASTSARHRESDGGHGSYWQTAGAHRADDGLAGPTRRYAFIVSVLVVMTSLPVLAAISAGSSTISDTALPGGATPFIPQPSDGPVVVPLPPSVLPPPFGGRGGDPIAALASSRWRTASAPRPPLSAQRPGEATSVGTAQQWTDGAGARSAERPQESGRPGPRPSGASSDESDHGCGRGSGRCRPTIPPPCSSPSLSRPPAVPSAPWRPSRSASPSGASGRSEKAPQRAKPARSTRTAPAPAKSRKPQVNASRKAQVNASRKAQVNASRKAQVNASRKAQVNASRKPQVTAKRHPAAKRKSTHRQYEHRRHGGHRHARR